MKKTLPDVCDARRYEAPDGTYILLVFDAARLREIFASWPDENNAAFLSQRASQEALCRGYSLALRYDATAAEIVEQLSKSSIQENDFPDQIAKVILRDQARASCADDSAARLPPHVPSG